MRKRDPSIPRIAGSRGASLVEVVVAAVVLGLTFVGTTSMLASGKGLESDGFLQRQASRIAVNALEDTRFGPAKYSTLPPTATWPDSLKSETGQTIAATVLVTISGPQFANFQDPDNPSQAVDYKRVEAKVLWPSGDPKDSLSLSKLIAAIP